MPASRKLLRHLLVVGDAVAIEHQHDDRALHGLGGDLAEGLEAVEQARHADGDAGGGNLLAGEALDEPVIAPAAHHRAEADRLPALVFDGRGQLGLEHGAGVIFEAAHDGGIDADPIRRSPPLATSLRYARQLLDRLPFNVGTCNDASRYSPIG